MTSPLSLKNQNTASSNANLRTSNNHEVQYESLSGLEFDTDAWFATPELRESTHGFLLELSVTWDNTLLDIAHYRHPKRITFGSDPRADFCYSLTSNIEAGSTFPLFPLIEVARTGDFLLCFDPDMDGSLEENGEVHSFLSLVQQGKAHSFARTGLFFYPLQPGAEIQLQCQENTKVQIRFVSSSPLPLQWLRSLDSTAPVLSFSIVIHLIMTVLAITSLTSPVQVPSKHIASKNTTQAMSRLPHKPDFSTKQLNNNTSKVLEKTNRDNRHKHSQFVVTEALLDN